LDVDRKTFYEVSKKIGCKDYHSAEAYEKNELLRLKVIGNALKEKVGENAEDVFYLMIHDMYQNIDGCKFIGEDMEEITNARELGLITELQFIRLMKLASNILPLYYYRGENTWNRDQLENQFRFESNYAIDYLKWVKNNKVYYDDNRDVGSSGHWEHADESVVKNSIQCAKILCGNRIQLSESDLYKINHGKELQLKYCSNKCTKGNYK
jgi:hypothetical protein